MRNILIRSFIFLLFFSCSNREIKKNDSESRDTVVKSIVTDSSNGNPLIESTIDVVDTLPKIEKECGCFNGIGSTTEDKPSKTHTFNNGIEVSICGYYEPENQAEGFTISEFDVFNCNSGKSYLRYGAIDNCRIISSNDTLIVYLLDFLPNNEKWEWNSVIQAKQIITANGDSLVVSPLIECYKKTGFNKAVSNDYLNSLENGKGYEKDWEDTIGRLKFLSLEGDSIAWDRLKNYDKYIGAIPDGAMAEDWKDAVATVRWITDFE